MGSTAQKKVGYRRMNQMNGDFLNQLKDQKRSEMNKIVIGTNKAVTTLMNKRLDLYYKDKNIALEKIRRRQDAVYGTMLRVQREKKILQRAMYKRRQEENRELHPVDKLKVRHLDESDENTKSPKYAKHESTPLTKDRTSSSKPKVDARKPTAVADTSKADVKDIDVHTEAEVKPDESENPQNVAPIREKTFERKARVLEVRKKAPLAPITRERSDIAAEVLDQNQQPVTENHGGMSKFSDIRAELLPERRLSSGEPSIRKETSVTDMVIDSVASAQCGDESSASQSRNGDAFPKGSLGASRRMSKSTMAMPTISEKEPNREVQTRHSDELVYDHDKRRRSRKLKSTETKLKAPVIASAFEHEGTAPSRSCSHSVSGRHTDNGGTPKKVTSLIEDNRRRAREKLRRQHRALERETVHVYLKDPKGNYVLSDADFKRREFKPPSMREKHFQEKMLRAQVEARLDQRNRLEDFFEKMAHEERERQRIRDAFKRQAQEEAEAERRKIRDAEEQLGFSASQLATLFSKGVLPEGMDPSSFEAIKYCKYIRTYSPDSVEAARQQAAREGKLSSWDAIAKLQQTF